MRPFHQHPWTEAAHYSFFLLFSFPGTTRLPDSWLVSSLAIKGLRCLCNLLFTRNLPPCGLGRLQHGFISPVILGEALLRQGPLFHWPVRRLARPKQKKKLGPAGMAKTVHVRLASEQRKCSPKVTSRKALLSQLVGRYLRTWMGKEIQVTPFAAFFFSLSFFCMFVLKTKI